MYSVLDLACEGCDGREASEALRQCWTCGSIYCERCAERNGCPTECAP